MSRYQIAATNSSQARYGVDVTADSETAALGEARDRSTEFPGISFGVFEHRPGCGSFLIASFLNGERRFTAREEG
jgi:hypothetical protein